jgi:hypothetical protein
MTTGRLEGPLAALIFGASLVPACIPTGTLLVGAGGSSTSSSTSSSPGSSTSSASPATGTGGTSTGSYDDAGDAALGCDALGSVDGMTYRVRSADTMSCATVLDNGTANDVALVEFGCQQPVEPNQQFTFHKVGDCLFTLTALSSDLCWSVAGSSQNDGAALVQYMCIQYVNQQFRLQATSDGHTRIVNVHSNKCVTVQGDLGSDGVPLVQYTCSSAMLGQTWILE